MKGTKRLERMKPAEAPDWDALYARTGRYMISYWDQCQREMASTRAALAPADHNLPTQYAYVMLCLAQIDGLSQRWRGGDAWKRTYERTIERRHKERNRRKLPKKRYLSPQTRRMVSFMRRYMGVKPSVGRIVVELYRHTLMHEGGLRTIRVGPRRYVWSVAWERDPGDHLRIRPPEPLSVNLQLDCSVLLLASDVGRAIRAYFGDLERDPRLQRNFRRLDDQRWDDLLA